MSKYSESQHKKLHELVETVHRLRAPGGCPWDREQTHQSLRRHLIEETFEVIDVLDQIDSSEKLKNPELVAQLKEELGDLLLQIALHSEMASEEKAFDFFDVSETLNEKLIRRHPHVFGSEGAATADEALSKWETQKMKEKAEKKADASILDGLPKSLPALQRTVRIIEKVTKVGFQWPDTQGPLAKVEEELEEFKNEVARYDFESDNEKKNEIRKEISNELGDLLFSVCNLAFMMQINPEDALRGTLTRFESRFRYVEQAIRSRGQGLEHATFEEMDAWWKKAKALEKKNS